jgi:hypothetical protein
VGIDMWRGELSRAFTWALGLIHSARGTQQERRKAQ